VQACWPARRDAALNLGIQGLYRSPAGFIRPDNYDAVKIDAGVAIDFRPAQPQR
jgi:hypothetical protein